MTITAVSAGMKLCQTKVGNKKNERKRKVSNKDKMTQRKEQQSKCYLNFVGRRMKRKPIFFRHRIQYTFETVKKIRLQISCLVKLRVKVNENTFRSHLSNAHLIVSTRQSLDRVNRNQLRPLLNSWPRIKTDQSFDF